MSHRPDHRPDRAAPAPRRAPSRTRPDRGRQRGILREILRLAAERSEAEAEIERTRRLRRRGGRPANTSEKKRARWIERILSRRRRPPARPTRSRRRAIADAAIAGDAAAKAEFARSSRKIAAEFDVTAKPGPRRGHRGQDPRDGRVRGRRAKKAWPSHRRSPQAGRRHVEDHRIIRKLRLADALRAYRHFGPPEAPTTPSPGAYRPDDSIDKVFDRIQKLESNLVMLEGLVDPQG